MKLNNIIQSVLLSAVALLSFTSCDSDIEKVFVLPSNDIALNGGSGGDIILNPSKPSALALAIYWSGNGQIALNDTLLQAPINATEETIQLSSDDKFTSPINLSVEKGTCSRQLLCEELNSILGRLGFVADEKAPLYVRVRSALASNVEPSYSNTLKVMVQPYRLRLALYFSGLVDWKGFDNYLSLYDKDNLSYGGAHWIDSEWGYRAYPQQDWGVAYKAADGATALSGNLILAESDGNIPAPEKGLYVMDFSIKNLTYELTKIESVGYAGLNDDWGGTRNGTIIRISRDIYR